MAKLSDRRLDAVQTDDHPSRIPFHLPAVPDIDAFLEDARSIVASGSLSEGPYVRELERRLSPWTGSDRVVAVSNCSDGLIAALSLVGAAGREVVVPGFTFLATWQAVEWAGGTSVVADVDERGLLDPAAVENAVGPSTVAIVAVHLAGSLADMARLRAIADRLGIALVADGAHGLGATRDGIVAGSVGDIEVFSIGATKQLAAGEGGFLTLRSERLEGAARRWGRQGRMPGDMNPQGAGMNLRLDELTAALALRQLDGYETQLRRRLAIHERYRAAWAGLPLSVSGPRPGERSALKDQLIWLDDPAERAGLRAFLAAAGIETRGYYETAVPDLRTFQGRVASADRSRRLAASSFAVPIHARLDDDSVERIADRVREWFRA